MKKMNLIVALLLITVSIFGQKTDAMLFGDVKDAQTGEHLPYVTLTVKGTTLGTTSDATGHFKLSNLPLGKQTIVVDYVGYKPIELVVDMKKNKSTELYIEMEEDVFDLQQVVVTGTRTSHYVKNVPIRTEVITAKALENKKAWNVFDALEGVPGIRVESQCQFCNFSMVRMQGLGAEHTQVLINGQPTYSGLASVYGLEQIGTGDVDRIEIVKGAGSALYNSSAVAGAINIITKEPTYQPSLGVDAQVGSYNSNILNLNASMRNEKGNIGLSIHGQRVANGIIDQTGEGMTRKEVLNKDGVSDRVETHLTNFGFGLYFFNPFFSNDKLVIRAKTMSERRRGGTIANLEYLNPFTSGTENITTDRYEGEMNYNVQINDNSNLNFSAVYVNHRREATNDTFLGSYMETHQDSTPNVEYMRPYIATENTFTPTLTFATTIDNHNLMVGTQGHINRLEESGLYTVVDSNSPYLGQPYKSIGHKHANELGAFIQDEWNVSDNFTVVPGIRIDHHESGEKYTSDKKVFDKDFPETSFKETSINPRIAIKYNPWENVAIRANFGTGFRAPYGFSEDLHLCSGSPRVWKSSELKGEKSISYNLSADYYGNHFQVSANLFRTDLKNKIDFADADDKVKNLGYTYQWENVDDAHVQGIEISILANPVRNLNLGLDFSLNDGKYKNVRDDWKGTQYERISQRIPRFASTNGSVKIEYTPKTWVFSLTGIYQGSMAIDYISEDDTKSKIKETNPFMTFNALVSKQFGVFKIYAGGKNLLGYVQDEKHLDDAAFMYAPVYGATFYGGIAIRLNQ